MSGETIVDINASTYLGVRIDIERGIAAFTLPVLKYHMAPVITILYKPTYPLRTKNQAYMIIYAK